MRFKDGFWDRISWGRPDSLVRELCGMCHGALPEVPIRCWDEEGAAFALCDACLEEWMEP